MGVDVTPELEAFREKLLKSMERLDPESSLDRFRAVRQAWWAFRHEVELWGKGQGAGVARRLLDALMTHPSYRNFDRIRCMHYHATDGYKAWRHNYDATRRGKEAKGTILTAEKRKAVLDHVASLMETSMSGIFAGIHARPSKSLEVSIGLLLASNGWQRVQRRRDGKRVYLFVRETRPVTEAEIDDIIASV